MRYQLGQRQPGARHFGLQGDLRGSLPIVALMVGIIALLDDRLQLATGQSPVLVVVMLVAATLLVIAGPGVRHARGRRACIAKWRRGVSTSA